MNAMKKIMAMALVAVLSLMVGDAAFADQGSFPINAIRANSSAVTQVWFTGSLSTSTTCKYSSSDAAFYAFVDPATNNGKAAIAMLTAMKIAGKTAFIDVTSSNCNLNFVQMN